MMKKIKYLIVSACMLLASCGEGFLERSPISNMNDLDFYKTEKDIQSALVAAYQTLHTLYGPEGLSSFYGELMSDNAYTTNTAGNVADYFDFQNGSVRPDNTLLIGYWNSYYQSIFRINNIIYKLSGAQIGNKEKYEGEARFLRSLYYFNMIQAWGRILLVTEPLTVSDAYAKGLVGETEVYAQIVADAEFAAANLPASGRFVGAATSGAANTLLGKAYLTMGKKAEAATALQKVYGKYSLVAYADLWDLTKKNCAESIFEIQYLGGKSNPYSRYWAMFSPIDNRIVTAWGAGMNQVSDDLWKAYETGDIRRDISIFDGYTQTDGLHNTTRFAAKWVDKKAELDGLREASNNNFIVFRYADVLLMLSEATGDAKYLNDVRARVGLPAFGAAGYPAAYSTLALAIEHERQVELALEFQRFFDLKRTGRAVEVMKSSFKGLTLNANKLILPIPKEVLEQNPALSQTDVYK